MNRIDFSLRGEHITLDALLKATGLATSGGAAKQLIAAGKVQVDGQEERRRGAKLRAGQVVAVQGTRVHLLVGDPHGDAEGRASVR
ncbi:RNA-binding S4 domain-containing protein [Methylibium sp.]|uniref:RNA-binding S4 domain-containing protein n=1 Tax=Methylibium sp. TaxID=2067992 RepID=UPI00286B9B09|nr:RNA-binding S4 domain-containing protein [Methylibium sp.]